MLVLCLFCEKERVDKKIEKKSNGGKKNEQRENFKILWLVVSKEMIEIIKMEERNKKKASIF